jgi:hypothetical protein
MRRANENQMMHWCSAMVPENPSVGFGRPGSAQCSRPTEPSRDGAREELGRASRLSVKRGSCRLTCTGMTHVMSTLRDSTSAEYRYPRSGTSSGTPRSSRRSDTTITPLPHFNRQLDDSGLEKPSHPLHKTAVRRVEKTPSPSLQNSRNVLNVKSLTIWLGGRDSNPDTVVQSHVSYRWTTSQSMGSCKLEVLLVQDVMSGFRCRLLL